MWKTAWDITSANSGAKRLKKNPDVTSWAEGQIRQVVSPSSLVPGPLSTLADRGRGLAPPPRRVAVADDALDSGAPSPTSGSTRPSHRWHPLSTADDGGERLLHLMGNGSAQLPHRHDARQVAQLSLRLAQLLARAGAMRLRDRVDHPAAARDPLVLICESVLHLLDGPALRH